MAMTVKNNKLEKSNDEAKIDIDKEKREEEEILKQYEKIGNLKDNESIKESEMTKNYDSNGNKYYNEYKLIKLIGRGAYSKVKLVIKDNIKYAMKIINKKELKKKKYLNKIKMVI